MFSIGEFSKLSKTNIRTLRYYDQINLFKPSFVEENGYRFYSTDDLNKLTAIVDLRRIGLSIKQVKSVLSGQDLSSVLVDRMREIEDEIMLKHQNIATINKILNQIKKGEYMEKYQAKEILLPKITVYYRHGVIKDMSKMNDFILEAGAECRENNPDLKCKNYCFVTYEAKEYQEKNVELEYAEQVERVGKESKNIKFKTIETTKAISVTHNGSYRHLAEAYAFAVNYVKEKGLNISDKIREVYIHGCWDCASEDDYVTEIQIPVK